MFTSLFACASATSRPDPAKNQDTALALPTAEQGGTLGIADGIGSLPRAQEASRIAIAAIEKAARSGEDAASLGDVFASTRQALYEAVQTGPEGVSAAAYGTTLLLARLRPETLEIGYLGNGAIYHLRGDFLSFGERQPVPFSFTNLLNPHVTLCDGKAALTRYLSGDPAEGLGSPGLLSLRRDYEAGDLLVLCTDGIDSPDECPVGALRDGSHWRRLSPPLIAIHHALRAALLDARAPLTSDSLTESLQRCLDSLRESGSLHDDASVAVLVTEEALAYRERYLIGQPPLDLLPEPVDWQEAGACLG